MKKVTLKHPVTHDGREYRELTMRRPKVRDIKVASKQAATDEERETTLFANLCEVAPSLIDELDMADYAGLQEIYRDFLSPVKTSSDRPAAS